MSAGGQGPAFTTWQVAWRLHPLYFTHILQASLFMPSQSRGMRQQPAWTPPHWLQAAAAARPPPPRAPTGLAPTLLQAILTTMPFVLAVYMVRASSLSMPAPPISLVPWRFI